MNTGPLASIKRHLSKNWIEPLAFVIFLLIGMLLAERPEVHVNLQQANVPVPTEEAKGDSGPEGIQESGSDHRDEYKNLQQRNIFSEQGTYTAQKGLLQIPDNPYNLIAVLKGPEKRAVFKEFTGDVVSLKVGDKLIDDAVVDSISELSVKVKKGDTLREYRLFEVKGILK